MKRRGPVSPERMPQSRAATSTWYARWHHCGPKFSSTPPRVISTWKRRQQAQRRDPVK